MMRRAEAIARILRPLGDELVVTANGWISREAYAAGDRPENFYMLGSMGLAAPIGLGLALTNPGRRVIVLDGDGNLLMALGILAMIAEAKPANLVHVVLDNESYGSTGGQRSAAPHVQLDAMARAAGYAHVTRVSDEDELDRSLWSDGLSVRRNAGPSFVLVKVLQEAEGTAPRVPHDPEQIALRFRALRDVELEVG